MKIALSRRRMSAKSVPRSLTPLVASRVAICFPSYNQAQDNGSLAGSRPGFRIRVEPGQGRNFLAKLHVLSLEDTRDLITPFPRLARRLALPRAARLGCCARPAAAA